jgi:shikimate 5-dehydrogenase
MKAPYAEVIGDPISHSKSPLIHGFWIDKLGIEARYDRCHVTPAALGDYFERSRNDVDWRGCNVTIPHKQAVMPLLDRIDPQAEAIGAVNIVVRTWNGGLTGYNSDGVGFVEPLRALLAERHLFRMARVIGSGGAARAIVHALADEGFTIAMIARDQGKALDIIREVDADAPETMTASLASWAEPADFAWDDRSGVLDLVVNTTSLGMQGQPPLAIDFSHVPPGALIYDIVYAPLETPLLAEARKRGMRTFDGLEMLVGQAAVAFERFFGLPAPREHDAELRALLTS